MAKVEAYIVDAKKFEEVSKFLAETLTREQMDRMIAIGMGKHKLESDYYKDLNTMIDCMSYKAGGYWDIDS